jgi:hypothetical protein
MHINISATTVALPPGTIISVAAGARPFVVILTTYDSMALEVRAELTQKDRNKI